jgi:hypothetical protein
MFKTAKSPLISVLVGCLLSQMSNLAVINIAVADTNSPSAKYSGSLIDQLDPNDACAWWNTTNPDNCTGGSTSGPTGPVSITGGTGISTSTGSGNADTWNWAGDPAWNSGSDNGIYNSDPYSSGGTFGGGGMYSPPQMGFLEKQLYSVISADYTAAVVQDMNGHGLWDSEAQDQVADEIISRYSRYSAGWGVMASGGIYLLDYLFLDKWRLPGAWYAGSVVGMGVGTGAAMIGESFKVMQNQMAMLLELMELYGELPSNISQRSNELSVALGWSLLGGSAGTFVNRMLALQAAGLPAAGAGAAAGTGAAAGAGVAVGTAGAGIIAGETLLGQTGVATAKAAEKTAAELVVKTGFLKAAIEKFGATKVGEIMAKYSTVFKIGISTAFAAGANYAFTYELGHHYKKNFRKIAQVHEHNVLESFKNDANAKQTVWLILTKNVFKPDATDEALTPEEAKLYAAIVSQQIPLLHFGTHNEPDALFKQYKAPVKIPTAVTSTGVTVSPSDIDFGLGAPKPPVANNPNEIDKKLEILNIDLDLQQRLNFVKLVEGGMLMKGFLSPRDVETLETISIALNLSPPPKHAFKDNDVRAVWHDKYKALRDGMNGEVNRKVLAFSGAPKFEQNVPVGDLRNKSGEIMMEEFFKPEQVALRAFADKIKFNGVIEQKDYAKFDSIAPILEGEEKLKPVTTLPTNTTADGSPRAIPPGGRSF